MKITINLTAGPWAVSAQMKRAIRTGTRVTRNRGRVLKKQPKIIFSHPENYKAAERELLLCLAPVKAQIVAPMTGPLRVRVDLSFPYRQTEPARVRKSGLAIPHAARPDLDNLSKLYLDCLVKSGIIEDDGLIAELTLTKYRTCPAEQGVSYLIETIE